MDETQKIAVKLSAEAIRAKLEGGDLYGFPLDMADPDAVLVAAVLQARREESDKASRDIDFLMGAVGP